ncbi:hypothetical protein C5167_030289 [Papaver somniferum]|nr:hypothetical protein C5167_030289 [Papaver somniferum]
MVMGAGCGISIHGRFRVVTEKTELHAVSTNRMYELINKYLSLSPGEYIGLTGARLDGPEMLACGLATHFVPSIV